MYMHKYLYGPLFTFYVYNFSFFHLRVCVVDHWPESFSRLTYLLIRLFIDLFYFVVHLLLDWNHFETTKTYV